MKENKNIIGYHINKDGEMVNIVYKYIDTNSLFNTLKEILTKERDEYCGDNLEKGGFYYDDDELEEYVDELVYTFNKEMRDYLHQDNHKISGNFNNLDYDYNYHKCAIINGKYDTSKIGGSDYSLDDCIKRLDCGEDSKSADEDRSALTEWFLDTFGTYNICYNFTYHLECCESDWEYFNKEEEESEDD